MGFVALLAGTTVLLGAMNNVTSKMRSVTFGPFNYMVVLLNSTLYLAVYATTLVVRYYQGIVHKSELELFWKRAGCFTNWDSRQVDNDGTTASEVTRPLLGVERGPAGDNSPGGDLKRRQDHKSSSMTQVGSRVSVMDNNKDPVLKPRQPYRFLDSPWSLVILAGTMDASGNLLGFIAQAHLPQVLYQLFLQNLVLFSVILSMLLLNRRYSVYHITGLVLTVISGFIGVVPDLKLTGDFRWGMIAALSTLPTAISYVTKERLFELYDEINFAHHRLSSDHYRGLDVFVVNTHVAIVQLVITPLLAPVNVLAGETNGFPLNVYLKDGYECLVHGTTPKHMYGELNTRCEYATYSYIAYILFNLGFNVSLVALTKYGSSVQTWMVVRLLLPVTLILLLWHGWPLLGAADKGINLYVFAGAILAFFGATVFRYSTIYIDSIKEKYNIEGEITCLWPLRI